MSAKIFVPILLAGVVACGGDRPSASSDGPSAAGPREVHFTATDFAFDGPSEIEAGLVDLVLTNAGENWHHLQLVRIPDGMTWEEFGQRMSEIEVGAPLPAWYRDVGGVNPPPAGRPAKVTMLVEEGEYAVVCVVDTPDKVPHVAKGMVRPLTVTPATRPAAELAETELSLTLADYAFGFSAPPTSGTHVIRVANVGQQSHEVAIFRFLPGKTMDDVMAWGATYDGPPPMEPVGGVPGIAVGQAVNIEVTLTPGEYVALCFLPDATDGAPHLVHGMVLPFHVS